MIYGIGTDLVMIERMELSLTRFGEHFADRLLAPSEHGNFFASRNPARFLSKRFAAKEALAKAAGTGLRHPVSLRSIAIVHTSLGQPEFRFSAELDAWLKARGIHRTHLSISDEQHYALAYVILES
jgi:holo-[acyl-carrier protein] synthase